MTRALIMCATIQAIWFSTYLLDPDLLASAVLFCYFRLILDQRTASDCRRSFMAGVLSGVAYLAKAYMLPFCVAQLAAAQLAARMFRLQGSTSAQSALRFRPLISLIVGLAIAAGPWVSALNHKYGRLTFTNAGRANHANVGPDNFANDPLWHPPLTPDYIIEPVMATDWSPFAK